MAGNIVQWLVNMNPDMEVLRKGIESNSYRQLLAAPQTEESTCGGEEIDSAPVIDRRFLPKLTEYAQDLDPDDPDQMVTQGALGSTLRCFRASEVTPIQHSLVKTQQSLSQGLNNMQSTLNKSITQLGVKLEESISSTHDTFSQTLTSGTGTVNLDQVKTHIVTSHDQPVAGSSETVGSLDIAGQTHDRSVAIGGGANMQTIRIGSGLGTRIQLGWGADFVELPVTTTTTETINGNDHVMGNQEVDGNQIVHGTSKLLSSLTVGTVDAPQPTTLNGAVQINGPFDLQGALVVGTATNPQPTTLHGMLEVDGAEKIGGPLTVGSVSWPQATTLNGAVTVNGGETVNGPLVVTGDTNVVNLKSTGATELNDAVIAGAATVGNTLDVMGETTLNVLNAGASTIASASVTGSLAAGATTLGVTTIGGTLGVTGDTKLVKLKTSGAAKLASLEVTGDATVGARLDVTGVSTLGELHAQTTTLKAATVIGAAALGSLSVTGVSTLSDASVTSLGTSGLATLDSASVTNDATVGGTLDVAGATTLQVLNAGASTLASAGVTGTLSAGASTLASATVKGGATVGGPLIVGSSEIPQPATVYGPLTVVQGASVQGGNFDVGSANALQSSTFYGPTIVMGGELCVGGEDAPQNLTVTGALNVGGATTLASALTVGSSSSPQATVLNGPLAVSGGSASIQGGGLTVGAAGSVQPTTLHGSVSVQSGGLTVGAASAQQPTALNGALSVVGSMTVGSSISPQQTTLNGDTTVQSGGFAVGSSASPQATTLNGSVSINGNSTVQSGDFTVGTSSVGQSTTLNGSLTVTKGPTSFQGGSVTVGSSASPQPTTLNGSVSVTGGSTNLQGGGLTVGNATLPQPTALTGAVSVVGSTSLQGGALAVGSMDSPQDTTLNGRLTVAGGDVVTIASTGALNLTAPTVNICAAGGTINLISDVSHVTSTETDIMDRTIHLNVGSGAGAGTSYLPVSSSNYGAGVAVQESGSVVAYAALSTDGRAWQFMAPLAQSAMRMDQSLAQADTPSFATVTTRALPANACVYTDATNKLSGLQLANAQVLMGGAGGPTARTLLSGTNGGIVTTSAGAVTFDLSPTSVPLLAGVRIGTGSAGVTLTAPMGFASNTNYALPMPTPVPNQFLTVDQSNRMSWAAIPAQLPTAGAGGYVLSSVSAGSASGTWVPFPTPVPTTGVANMILRSTGVGSGAVWSTETSPFPSNGAAGQFLQSNGSNGVRWAAPMLTGFQTLTSAPQAISATDSLLTFAQKAAYTIDALQAQIVALQSLTAPPSTPTLISQTGTSPLAAAVAATFTFRASTSVSSFVIKGLPSDTRATIQAVSGASGGAALEYMLSQSNVDETIWTLRLTPTTSDVAVPFKLTLAAQNVFGTSGNVVLCNYVLPVPEVPTLVSSTGTPFFAGTTATFVFTAPTSVFPVTGYVVTGPMGDTTMAIGTAGQATLGGNNNQYTLTKSTTNPNIFTLTYLPTPNNLMQSFNFRVAAASSVGTGMPLTLYNYARFDPFGFGGSNDGISSSAYAVTMSGVTNLPTSVYFQVWNCDAAGVCTTLVIANKAPANPASIDHGYVSASLQLYNQGLTKGKNYVIVMMAVGSNGAASIAHVSGPMTSYDW